MVFSQVGAGAATNNPEVPRPDFRANYDRIGRRPRRDCVAAGAKAISLTCHNANRTTHVASHLWVGGERALQGQALCSASQLPYFRGSLKGSSRSSFSGRRCRCRDVAHGDVGDTPDRLPPAFAPGRLRGTSLALNSMTCRAPKIRAQAGVVTRVECVEQSREAGEPGLSECGLQLALDLPRCCVLYLEVLDPTGGEGD
jgi:hypothetical protein